MAIKVGEPISFKFEGDQPSLKPIQANIQNKESVVKEAVEGM